MNNFALVYLVLYVVQLIKLRRSRNVSVVTLQLRKRLQKKLLLVEIESDEDDYECGTEVGIQLEPKDEY